MDDIHVILVVRRESLQLIGSTPAGFAANTVRRPLYRLSASCMNCIACLICMKQCIENWHKGMYPVEYRSRWTRGPHRTAGKTSRGETIISVIVSVSSPSRTSGIFTPSIRESRRTFRGDKLHSKPLHQVETSI